MKQWVRSLSARRKILVGSVVIVVALIAALGSSAVFFWGALGLAG